MDSLPATKNNFGAILDGKPLCSRTRIKIILRSQQKTCRHSRIIKQKCVDCAEPVPAETHYVALDYISEGLKMGVGEIARCKNHYTSMLFARKKLTLVLDLDHTLIHAKEYRKLTSKEEVLLSRAASNQDSSDNIDGDLLKLDSVGFLLKLRPFVRKFLKEVSSMFEIYVCTKGNRFYASKIVKVLDPNDDYLSNTRVITREDIDLNGGNKSLSMVLARENSTIIVDDTKDVWDKDNMTNLIEVGKYVYFQSRKEGKHKSWFGKKRDESESNGALSNVLRVLKTVHGMFFDSNVVCRDVRRLMFKIRGEILKGCKLYISDDSYDQNSCLLWSMAEEMGCGWTMVPDFRVTHVLAEKTGSEGFRWAVEEKKFAVHPRWIYAAYYLWCKQPEELYQPLL